MFHVKRTNAGSPTVATSAWSTRLASATCALDIRYARGREFAPNPQGYIFLQRVIASPELSPRCQKHRERARNFTAS